KIGPALCAGNTLVLKAAEDAPLGVLLLAEVCQEFLPSGVLNVLTGLGEECGAPLANHPTVSKLSFTGSTEAGKLIMRAASDRLVPVSLELAARVLPSSSRTPTRTGSLMVLLPRCASRGRASLVRRALASSSTATSSTIFSMHSVRK